MAPDAYLQRLATLAQRDQLTEAEAVSAEAMQVHPTDPRLQRARAVLLRRTGQQQVCEGYLARLLETNPCAAWLHAQLGVTITNTDRPRAVSHFRRALELQADPDVTMALIQALERETGDTGGDSLEEAYQLLRPLLPNAPNWHPTYLHIAFTVLSRVCAFDELEALGDPMELGRSWAEADDHTALFLLLGYAGTPSTRADLLQIHKTAAGHMTARAERDPF